MPTKPKKIGVPVPPKQQPLTTTEFARPLTLPQALPIFAEPPKRPKRKAAIRAQPTTKSSQKQKRTSPSITESDESTASTQTRPPTLSVSSEPSRKKRRQMLKEQQIKNRSILTIIQLLIIKIKIPNLPTFK